MKIANDRILADLQADFQQVFPYLKIEFFKSSHQYGEETIQEPPLNPTSLLGEVRTKDNFGIISLDENQQTSDFEKLLATIYGLNVQVFRKSYGKWLQTWATDNWTLKEQNDRSAKMGDKSFEKPANQRQKNKDKIFN